MKVLSMKFILIVLILTVFNIFHRAIYSQERNKYSMITFGMWNFGDTIGIDETEILIEEYLEFIFYNNPYDFPSFIKKTKLTEQEINKLKTLTIDSSLLPIVEEAKKNILSILTSKYENREVKLFSFMEGKFYVPIHKDSAINKTSIKRITEKLKTPVTGITYEQAIAYCKWRTSLDSIRFYDSRYKVEKKYLREPESYIYSLLSPEEYDLFIPICDSLTNNKKWSTFNYKSAYPPKKNRFNIIKKDYGISLLRTGSYYYHSRKISKLIDIKGNAAEMTNVRGIAKGGSYYHYAKDSERGIINYYQKPEMWLGFRCCAKRRIK